jgi:nucleoside-diphosphate-sugar epimerase
MLVRFAVKKGYAGYIGDGKSAWSTVHIRDLARGFMTLLQHMETAQAEEFLANPYFFCESSGANEPSWLDVALVIGRELYTLGKVDTPEPQTIPAEAYVDCAGPLTPALLGMNSRSRALRLRKLGWRPSEKSWDQSLLEDEIPAMLQPN